MREEIRRWFTDAEESLKDAQAMCHAGRNAATVFHCQQAIEKSLKALYMLRFKADAPRVHSLIFFGKEVGSPERFADLFRELTPAYTETRYSDASIESPELIYGGGRAEHLLEQTEEFFLWIRSELTKK